MKKPQSQSYQELLSQVLQIIRGHNATGIELHFFDDIIIIVYDSTKSAVEGIKADPDPPVIIHKKLGSIHQGKFERLVSDLVKRSVSVERITIKGEKPGKEFQSFMRLEQVPWEQI